MGADAWRPRVSGIDSIRDAGPFFEWLATWHDTLPTVAFDEVFPQPVHGAVLTADLIAGFCSVGPLASERINAVVPVTVELLLLARQRGMHRFVLAQDTHAPDSPEFDAWGPHCIRGTAESRMVPELESLAFAGEFTVIEKNALSAGIGTGLEAWLECNDDITDYLITGDCTDLCAYNLAMFVRMWANATNRQGRRVTVDAAAVQTYDLPVADATGVFPHPGDFTHMFFLYHMALNGIQVVGKIDLAAGARRD
jgi:nicotinamidase-related amidase